MKLLQQCQLRKENSVLMTWVPTKLARVGKVVSVDGIRGWVIEDVYETVVTSKELNKLQAQAYNTRETSDI